MIELREVLLSNVEEGSYRDSRRPLQGGCVKAVKDLFDRLTDLAQTGQSLPIHLAHLGDQNYMVIDGHICLDVYRSMGRETFQAIVHSLVDTPEKARVAYISMNYLRSNGWMRKMVILREELVKAGQDAAVRIMADPELAVDLIQRQQEQWEKFSTVIEEPGEAHPMEAMFGGIE